MKSISDALFYIGDILAYLFGQKGDKVSLKLRLNYGHHVSYLSGVAVLNL